MTREEMAQRLDERARAEWAAEQTDHYPAHDLDEIAAELRKVCGSCRYFQSNPAVTEYGLCWELHNHVGVRMPADGSGFCHRWESQPAGKAQD